MKQRSLILVSLLFVLGSSFAAAQEPKPGQAPVNAPAPTQAVASDNPVVVRLDGKTITEKEVLKAIDDFSRSQQLQPQQMQQKNVLFFKEAVDSLIAFALLKEESKEKSITPDETKVDQTYKSMVARFPSEAEFKKALSARGLTEQALRHDLEDSQVYQQVIDLATKDLPPASDPDIQKFYDENPKYFATPEEVHAAHILIRVAKDATPEKRAEAKSKLESLRADIESKKITFAEAAEKNSEDPGTAKKGGDLGFFSRGQMVKPFEDAAFSTTPGSLSPVIETQYGYHLIEVIALKPAGKTSLEQAKANIKNFLDGKAKQEAVQKHVAELRQKAKIEMLMTPEEWNKRNAPKPN